MTDTIIDLIRHGEPVGGRAYRGHNIDDPLSEKGWQQMWAAVGEHCHWSHIVSSPLLRCQAFAEALAEKHKLMLSIDQRLKEIGFGEWEGKTPDQIKQQRLTEYNAFYADPVNKRPPGAEDLNSFIHRVTRAYQDIADYYIGKQVLVVAHAGVMRAIIAHVLHAEPLGLYRIKVNNAGITRIRISERGAMLEYHNHCLK
ncbi:MAG: alpha-ribazole phosphatase family protein [Granulosicoccaceae bacterium]|jgi:probable phosphoglycerate mutase